MFVIPVNRLPLDESDRDRKGFDLVNGWNLCERVARDRSRSGYALDYVYVSVYVYV